MTGFSKDISKQVSLAFMYVCDGEEVIRHDPNQMIDQA
jgi:hypothetical protein